MTKKEFTPRSLVGMSQSARKRRARVEAENRKRLQVGGTEPTGKGAPLWLIDRRFILATWRGPRWAAEQYSQMRIKYRIGQRLRPCPGCPECLGARGATYAKQQSPGSLRWYMHSAECIKEKQRVDMCDGYWIDGTPCDGSGVLPAGAGR